MATNKGGRPAKPISMTTDKIIRRIAAKLNITQAQSRRALYAMLTFPRSVLAKGQDVYYHRLGTFYVGKLVARAGRNPRTGAPIRITARKKIKFRSTTSK
jgi:DNA-binding protein HU-beta